MRRTMCAALAGRTLARCGADVLVSPGMQIEQKLMQHGDTSVFDHALGVAFMSLYLVKRFHLRVDERSLTRGALLHDYFLYDWHEPGHGRLHGIYHPGIALRNAKKEFALNALEENVILRHMFPLGMIPPGSREGWLVCMSDKLCAICETIRTPIMSRLLREAIICRSRDSVN